MTDMWEQRLGVWWIAQDHPETLAILDSPEGQFTYAELAGSAHQLVHTFRSLGLAPGAIIAVMAPNGVTPIQVALASQEGGYSFILVNSYLTPDETVTMLEHADAAALVLHERHIDLLDGETGARIKNISQVLGVGASFAAGAVEGVKSLDELRATQPITEPEDRLEGTMIAYSSGTTGKPKGIRRPKVGGGPSEALNSAAVFGRAFGYTPFDGPQLVSTAMYHGGSYAYYMGALNVGHALIIMPKFDAEGTLAMIDKYKVRTAYMVATQFHRLLQLPEAVKAKYDMSSLAVVAHSAAPCPRAIKQRMFDWWGPVIWETYGGMEGAATIAKPQRWLEKPGTVGRAVAGVRISIRDDNGDELPAGESGNIYYETRDDFTYHRDEALTKQAHVGKQFTIGDIGYLDADGYLFIMDRAKDMIISGGVNIFPAEIEAVLLDHPAVSDVAVVGIPDDEWGESVLAVVELRAGQTASPDMAATLLAHCAEHLAAYKRPKRLEFRDSLPRTDAGKLYKRQIRDEFWKAAGRQI